MSRSTPECVRILEGDLFRLNERFVEWRAVVAARALEFDAEFLAREAVTILDLRTVSGDPLGKPFLDAYDSLSRLRNSVGPDGEPDPRLDTSFSVTVIPNEGRRELYGIVQSKRLDWIAEFVELPWVERVDPEALREDVEDEDWETWRLSHASGDRAERPVKRRGFVFDCRQDPVSLRADRLLPFVPDMKSRCERIAKDVEYKRWLAGRNSTEDSRNLMASILGFVEWCVTEDGKRQLADTATLVGRKLHGEVTYELLLGQKLYGRDWVQEDVAEQARAVVS